MAGIRNDRLRLLLFSPSMRAGTSPKKSAYLLPAYDEFTVAYIHRSAALDPERASQMDSREGLLSPAMVIDGRIVGTWNRRLQKASLIIAPRFFSPATEKTAKAAFERAARRYGEFLDATAMVMD